MYKLKSSIEDSGVTITIYKNEINICDYIFKSKEKGTTLGKRLVYITLLRYVILDCLGVRTLRIDIPLNSSEIDYLNNEVLNMIQYTLEYNDLVIESPILSIETFNNSPYNDITLNRKNCYIGYSGGKDSTLCYSFIKDQFVNITKFKIDFDSEEFNNEYYETYKVLNHIEYKKISTRDIYIKNNKLYYQEEDLHCCFAAPYFSIQNGDPAFLSVGLQYDVVNPNLYDSEHNKLSEYGLTETFESLKTIEKLFKTYGLIDFKMIVPLASLTSFTIYNILNREKGWRETKKLISCWSPENNKPCGECLKCLRVSYIYNEVGIPLSNKEKENIIKIETEDIPLDYLFGSKSIKVLIDKKRSGENINLIDDIYTDDKITELDLGINKYIANKYGLNIKVNPLSK